MFRYYEINITEIFHNKDIVWQRYEKELFIRNIMLL